MKKVVIVISLLLSLFLYGCSSSAHENFNDVYILAFDALLEKDSNLANFDYISLFIDDEQISTSDFTYIENYFSQKYEKDIYSYTKDEINQVGAYGKEDLGQEGVYLYITELVMEKNKADLKGEKYYTLKNLEALGMEIIVKRKDGEWELEQRQMEWEGNPF